MNRKRILLSVVGATMLLGVAPRIASARIRPVRSGQTQQQRSQVFVGTIVKKGETVIFSDNNGTSYRIDDVVEAGQLVGKRVRIVGILDTKNSLIHVESIEQVS